MKVIIGCEFSGVVRRAFTKLGHDVYSCDLLPSTDNSDKHIVGDIRDLTDDWDLGIFHPPCDYLTVSAAWAFGDGPYHQKVKPETLVGAARRAAREDALDLVRWIMERPYRHALENPIGAISTSIRKPDQIIQPYEFGEDASKSTCLWLKGLKPLIHTLYVQPRVVDGKPRWSNQTDSGQNRLTPSLDRWKHRSNTYEGIASAMANQWGNSDD